MDENLIENGTGKERKKMPTTVLKPSTIEAKSTISRAGQITFPAKIMKQLGLKEGDQLRFILNAKGEIRVEPISLLTAEELFGIFDQPGDNDNFQLDLDSAREERAGIIMDSSHIDGGNRS
ncbi:AbrB family transcriptional regulator [Paenibacillus sp. FSL R7-277]|uniref:AbrB/MazE/SpoVT family DNA-binding domain-containing protein n=1 Tax=unclassified Paenibacillus TaxID=185978 RepID=UPI0003E27D89|nr:AbrB/MazE/SpoVT family DNA-binding domain-containing protein [Paenibacillus sp. FSL R7-277]ETT72404.1 AbrB family transcriptional regulator [Paenibacillus sp. FSL R7-277]